MSAAIPCLEELMDFRVRHRALFKGLICAQILLLGGASAFDDQSQIPVLPEQIIINLDESNLSPGSETRLKAVGPFQRRSSELFGAIQSPALRPNDLFNAPSQISQTAAEENDELILAKQKRSASKDIRSALSYSHAVRLEPAAEPGKGPIFLRGKPLRRFRVLLDASDLTALLPAKDAFRMIPSSFIGNISIDQGLLSGSNHFQDFYPSVHFTLCDPESCFEELNNFSGQRVGLSVSGSSSGERTAMGQFGTLKSRNAGDAQKPVGAVELEKAIWSADLTRSSGKTKVRNDNNTLLDTSDDSTVYLRNLGYGRRSFMHNSSYFIPSIATRSKIVLVNSELMEGLGYQEDSAQAKETVDGYSSEEVRNPVAFKTLQMAQIAFSHLDSSTGGRLNLYTSGLGTKTYIPRSVYEPGNPSTFATGRALKYGLEFRSPYNPFAVSSQKHFKLQQYLVGVTLDNSTSENASTLGPVSQKQKRVKTQRIYAHAAIGVDLWHYQFNKISVGFFNSSGSQSTSFFAQCQGFPEYLCSKSSRRFEQSMPQWGTNLNLIHPLYQVQLLAQLQSRGPDAIERFGNYSGVKANPSLRDERQTTLGISFASRGLKIEYLHSQEENVIVPEAGTSSTSPLIVFVNQEPTQAHQISAGASQTFADRFELKGQYFFNRSFPVAQPSLVTPRTPQHTITAELGTKRLPLLDLGNNQVLWFSGIQSNWQSKFYLDTKNLVEFQPKMLFKPWAGLVVKNKSVVADDAFSVLSCSLQAEFSYPEEATQTDALGNSYTVYHAGVEGNPSTDAVYTLTLRGEF